MSQHRTETLRLRPGRPQRVGAGSGLIELRCLTGELWVTSASDGRDFVLHPGQRLFVDARGETLIEALDDNVELLLASVEPGIAA